MSGFQEFFERFKEIKRNQLKSPLHEAVYSGEITRVQECLAQQKTDINTPDELGNTPLHTSVEKDYTDIVKILLQHGASVNTRTNNRNTPIHFCTSVSTAQILLEQGASIHATNDRRETLLHHCACGASLQLQEYLVKHGAPVNAANVDGETVLHQISALAYNSENIISLRIFLNHGADVSIKDASLKTALHHASRHGLPESIELLISCNAKLDGADTAGNYPIHYTVTNYHFRNDNFLEWLPLYCQNPALVNLVDARGRSILHLSAEYYDEHVIQFILDNGGDARIVDHLGKTFLHHTINNSLNGENIIRFATENGFDLNMQDYWGQTPLHEALVAGNEKIVSALVKANANVHKTDITGMTPLHLAALRQNSAFDELLIKAGADINTGDENGATPLHFAAWADADKVIEILLDGGADKGLTDANKETAIMTAHFKRSHAAAIALDKDSNVIPYTSCANMCLSYGEVSSLTKDSEMLKSNIKDKKEFLKSVLETPFVGRGIDEAEAKRIQFCIEDFVQTIASTVCKDDTRMKCVVLHAGSSSEGTKTKAPDEFDFMLCLENLSEHIEVTFQEGNYGTINLNVSPVKKTEESTMEERSANEKPIEMCGSVFDYVKVNLKQTKEAAAFFDIADSYEVPCVKMYDFFGELLTKTILGKDFPRNKRLLPIEVTSAPSVLARWRGSRYKDLLIDIDIVPAVILQKWSDRHRRDLRLITQDMSKLVCLAVPKLSAGQDEDLWRCSLALVETAMFRRFRPHIRNSYIICKAILSSEILPHISFEDYTLVRQHYLDRHDSLSSEEFDTLTFYESPERLIPSYILKMTFLSVVEELAGEKGIDDVYDDTANKEQEALDVTVKESPLNISPDSASADILRSQVTASNETEKCIYGPAISMYEAERSLDFNLDIVTEVIDRCINFISDEYVPSFFSEYQNVLGERILTGDAYKVEVFFKLLKTLITSESKTGN